MRAGFRYQLTKDQITTLTAGIVQADILKEEWNGKIYHLTAKISADPNEVVKSVDSLRKDQEKSKELDAVKKRADAALAEVVRLTKELEIVRKDKTKLDQYNAAIQTLTTNEIVEKGMELSRAGNHESAAKIFTEAIKINPKYSWAYYHRGITYKKVGNYKQAVDDFNEVLKIDTTFSWAYYHRGLVYKKLGYKDKSLKDFKKAARLGDRYAQKYLNKRKMALLTF